MLLQALMLFLGIVQSSNMFLETFSGMQRLNNKADTLSHKVKKTKVLKRKPQFNKVSMPAAEGIINAGGVAHFDVVSTSHDYMNVHDQVSFAMDGNVLFSLDTNPGSHGQYGTYTCVVDMQTGAAEDCGQFFYTNGDLSQTDALEAYINGIGPNKVFMMALCVIQTADQGQADRIGAKLGSQIYQVFHINAYAYLGYTGADGAFNMVNEMFHPDDAIISGDIQHGNSHHAKVTSTSHDYMNVNDWVNFEVDGNSLFYLETAPGSHGQYGTYICVVDRITGEQTDCGKFFYTNGDLSQTDALEAYINGIGPNKVFMMALCVIQTADQGQADRIGAVLKSNIYQVFHINAYAYLGYTGADGSWTMVSEMFHPDDAIAEGDVTEAAPAQVHIKAISTSHDYMNVHDQVQFEAAGNVLFALDTNPGSHGQYGTYTCVVNMADGTPIDCGKFFYTNGDLSQTDALESYINAVPPNHVFMMALCVIQTADQGQADRIGAKLSSQIYQVFHINAYAYVGYTNADGSYTMVSEMFHPDDAVAEGDVSPGGAPPALSFNIKSTSMDYTSVQDFVTIEMNGEVLFHHKSAVNGGDEYGVYTCVVDRATLATENCGNFFATNYGDDYSQQWLDYMLSVGPNKILLMGDIVTNSVGDQNMRNQIADLLKSNVNREVIMLKAFAYIGYTDGNGVFTMVNEAVGDGTDSPSDAVEIVGEVPAL